MTSRGRLAQLVEHCDHTAGVTGSSPVAPTRQIRPGLLQAAFYTISAPPSPSHRECSGCGSGCPSMPHLAARPAPPARESPCRDRHAGEHPFDVPFGSACRLAISASRGRPSVVGIPVSTARGSARGRHRPAECSRRWRPRPVFRMASASFWSCRISSSCLPASRCRFSISSPRCCICSSRACAAAEDFATSSHAVRSSFSSFPKLLAEVLGLGGRGRHRIALEIEGPEQAAEGRENERQKPQIKIDRYHRHLTWNSSR